MPAYQTADALGGFHKTFHERAHSGHKSRPTAAPTRSTPGRQRAVITFRRTAAKAGEFIAGCATRTAQEFIPASTRCATRARMSERRARGECRVFTAPHPAGAGNVRPRHPAGPAGEGTGGAGMRRKSRASPTAQITATRSPTTLGDRHDIAARPCKLQRTEVQPTLAPIARLTGRGWHERWPPPATGAEAPPPVR